MRALETKAIEVPAQEEHGWLHRQFDGLVAKGDLELLEGKPAA